MSSISETILTQNVHPGDSTPQTVVGEAFKGDGYYGRADGFHTVQYNVVDFNGTIKMQGTLATTPVDADWGDIAGTEESGSGNSYFKNFTGNFVFVRAYVTYTKLSGNSYFKNFTGNFVFVRAYVTYTAGTVTSILLNH